MNGSRFAPGLDVVVFVADALRADALSLARPTRGLRSLDARLDGWLRFDRYVSAAPWTLPACTSLLSGLSVGRHRHFIHGRGSWTSLVPLLAPTHRTIGIVNNTVLTGRSGIRDGFEVFEHIVEYDAVFRRATEVLAEPSDRPRFLLVHSNLVHDYYLPMSEEIHADYFPDHDDWYCLHGRVNSWSGEAQQHIAGIRCTYRACALRLSERFQELLDAIDLERTVVVFIADHGEGLEPHRARVHHGGRLHDDLIRVPFAMHLPRSVSASARAALERAAATTVGTSDVLPSVLGVLGIDPPAHIDGRDLTQSGSVGERHVSTSMDGWYLYLRNRFRMNANAGGKHMGFGARVINRSVLAILVREHLVSAFVEWPHKLIVTEVQETIPGTARLGRRLLARLHNGAPCVMTRNGRWFGVELFDLESDPGESRNLLLEGHDPERVAAILASHLHGDGSEPLGPMSFGVRVPRIPTSDS